MSATRFFAVALAALAAYGCPPPSRHQDTIDRHQGLIDRCSELGGVARIGDTAGGNPLYKGCDFPAAPCPCVERFRPGAWDCSGAVEWMP